MTSNILESDAEITELLASSYEVDEKEIRDDVISTIERLYDSGLLAG